MANILVVEDDRNIRLLIAARLKNRYSVTTCDSGISALEIIEKGGIDLVVTDVMMDEMDGLTLLETLRADGINLPVIMLTAKDTIADKGRGFALGCDDYMTKPVNFEELIWRVDALLRRAKINSEQKIVIGDMVLDASRYTLKKGDEEFELPTKEFQLLFLLLSYPGKIFTKENILDSVWGYNSESDESTVRTHINRLRNRFENFGDFEIATIRGVGYKAVIKK